MATAAERSRAFRDAHPGYYQTPERAESARRRQAAARAASPELRARRVEQERERRYRRLYDMSVADYEALLDYQDGVCAICGRPPGKTRLHVDHDHKTGDVRGLLCAMCNKTLSERVTMEWLHAAYEYLDVPPVQDALGRTPAGVKGRVTSKRNRRKKRA